MRQNFRQLAVATLDLYSRDVERTELGELSSHQSSVTKMLCSVPTLERSRRNDAMCEILSVYLAGVREPARLPEFVFDLGYNRVLVLTRELLGGFQDVSV